MPNDPAPSQPTPALPKGRQRRYNSRADVIARAKKATQGIKVGRPLTYSPDLCKRAIALGHIGKHWAAIAREFGVGRPTLYEWAGKYPEFNDALIRARAASQAWWEDKVQQKLGAKHFQANAARLVMAGQFKEDYSETPQRSASDIAIDLLAAIDKVADNRARQLTQAAPGDDARAIQPLDVVTDEPAKDRSGTDNH